MREAGVGHALLLLLRGDAQVDHLLGLLLAAPPQLRGMVGRNHALVRGELWAQEGSIILLYIVAYTSLYDRIILHYVVVYTSLYDTIILHH